MYLFNFIKSNNVLNERIKFISEAKNFNTKKINSLFADYIDIIRSKKYKVLVYEYNDSIEAKNKLDDKAKSLLIATSLFSTLLGAYVTIINLSFSYCVNVAYLIILFSLIFLSLFFIMLSGIFATIIITEKNYVFKYNENKTVDISKLKLSIIGNRLYNIKRNNYLYCVSLSLKYGFIFSIISFLLFIIAA